MSIGLCLVDRMQDTVAAREELRVLWMCGERFWRIRIAFMKTVRADQIYLAVQKILLFSLLSKTQQLTQTKPSSALWYVWVWNLVFHI